MFKTYDLIVDDIKIIDVCIYDCKYIGVIVNRSAAQPHIHPNNYKYTNISD